MEIIMTTYNDDDVSVAPIAAHDVSVAPIAAHDVSVAPNTADDIQPETVSEAATKLEKPPSTDHFVSPLLIPENTPQPSPQITTKSEFQTNGSEQAVGDEQEDAYNYGIQLPPNKKLKSSPISEVQPVMHEVQPEQGLSQNLEEIAAASTFESASESISKKRKSSPISDVQPEHDLSPHLEEIALPEEIATSSTFESASESKSKKLKLSPISDVQPLKPEVQSEHDLSPHLEIASPEEIATASTLESASDPKNKKLKSSPISDVQPVKPEVQPEDDLSQNLEEIATPERTDTPEEIATPSTTKLSSKSKSKKSKKKSNNNVWARPTSRKGKKKPKANCNNGNQRNTPAEDDKVLILPIPKFPDKTDDNPELSICLSKFYKAEKVEISEDRLSAGSTKGYRMVRATRGVVEGAWYFEIKVMHLGETGHTRLGWSTVKGDLQAPVGFDANSFGYRDVDGSKVHKALREVYGKEGYGEGDVIGFYINLPDGSLFEPKPPRYVWFKGQRYVAPDDEDPPKVVPGSEICFFKNGICQGTAFTDLFGGRYFPAASMYTLPNQSNCLVKFNFGPDFDSFPGDFGGRQLPRPMIEVPYHGCDGRVENGSASLWNSPRTSTMLKVTKEQGTLFVGAAELDID